MAERRKGNWADDTLAGLRNFVVLGMVSMFLIPVLLIVIVILVVTR